MADPPDRLRFLINHIAFPPQLPTADDQNAERHLALLEFVIETMKHFTSFCRNDTTCLNLINALTLLRNLHDDNCIPEVVLKKALINLKDSGVCCPDSSLELYVY